MPPLFTIMVQLFFARSNGAADEWLNGSETQVLGYVAGAIWVAPIDEPE
jgi:hypothetical protein